MKNNEAQIKKLATMIESAMISINWAREILNDLTWGVVTDENSSADFIKAAASLWTEAWASAWWDSKVVEWIFDWEKMIDSEWFSHPIPANYISKSKLVEWDWLKLTISDEWRFLYKQIRPVPRRHITWTLTIDNDQYKVIADWQTYKVILAAITYFKAGVWDRISVIVPCDKEAIWAAVDAVIPS